MALSIRERARRELAAKVRLEARLRQELRPFERATLLHFTRTASLGRPDVFALLPRLERILRGHYDRVGAQFSRRCNRELATAARLTGAEAAAVDDALTRFYDLRARRQAQFITDTTQRRASFRLAQAIEFAAPGDTQRDHALNAAAALRRDLVGRRLGILVTETQAIAEVAKQAEADVLLGRQPLTGPAVADPARPPTDTIKEWVSQGDSIVRPTHLAADGVQVPVDQAFTIGGAPLMHPGDSSLGAPLREIVKCRCSSVIDVESVESSRQDIAGPDAPPPPLILPG